MLFRILDMDANGRVGLGELLMLKNAIDNGITALPARPSMGDDEEDPMSSREIVLKIDHYEAVQARRARGVGVGAPAGRAAVVWSWGVGGGADLEPLCLKRRCPRRARGC